MSWPDRAIRRLDGQGRILLVLEARHRLIVALLRASTFSVCL